MTRREVVEGVMAAKPAFDAFMEAFETFRAENDRSLANLASQARYVRAVNAHDDLVKALEEARLQIEYLHDKFQQTGTGNLVLARIEATLTKARAG